MEEEVQGGPACGRGRGGRGSSGYGRPFKTSSSPSRLLERTAMYRMKEIVPTQSSDVFNTPHGWST